MKWQSDVSFISAAVVSFANSGATETLDYFRSALKSDEMS